MPEEMAARGILENTRAAFAAALAAGAGFVESDCHLTSDGRVVLFHDSDLTRLFGDVRQVNQVPYAELSGMMTERGGLIALDDALIEFPEAHFNIDMKSVEVAEAAGTVIGSVAPHRALITSFSETARVRALAAAATATGAAAGRRPATSASRAGIVRLLLALAMRSRKLVERALSDVDALQIPERYGLVQVLSPRLLDAAHAHGVEVHVWTVNEAANMRRLVALGVDGIVTDRTDLAVQVLRSQP